MKRSSKFALASLLLASSTFAATPSEGWYWGLSGGPSYTPSVDISGPNPLPLILINNQINPNPVPVAANTTTNYVSGLPVVNTMNPSLSYPVTTFTNLTNGSVEYKVGGNFAGQLGYRICNFRVEGELLFNYAPLSMVKIGGSSIKRHVTLTNPFRISGQTVLGAGLINGYYDFYDEEYDPTWVPYLGLGIGYASVRDSVTFSLPFLYTTNFSVNVKDTSRSAIGQAILGISYFASDDLSIGLDYRYIRTKKSSSNLDTSFQTNTFNLNFNYYFYD